MGACYKKEKKKEEQNNKVAKEINRGNVYLLSKKNTKQEQITDNIESPDFSNVKQHLEFLRSNLEILLDAKEIDREDKLRKFMEALGEINLIQGGLLKELTQEGSLLNESKSLDLLKESLCELTNKILIKILHSLKEKKTKYAYLVNIQRILHSIFFNFDGLHLEALKDEMISRIRGLYEAETADTGCVFRKLILESENFEALLPEIYSEFLKNVELFEKEIIWKEPNLARKLAKEELQKIRSLCKSKQQIISNCLKQGLFDKNELKDYNFENTLIFGDDGGLFLLFNHWSKQTEDEKSLLKDLSPSAPLRKSTNNDNSLTKDEGFNNFRHGLCIFGNEYMEPGDLVYVIKKHSETEASHDHAYYNSIFEGYFLNKFRNSEYSGFIIDTAFIRTKVSQNNKIKSYIIVKIEERETADKLFENPKFQKWEFQKPYIVQLLKKMQDLLVNNRIFYRSLKSSRTIFDPLTRKIEFQDLGDCFFIERGLDIQCLDITNWKYEQNIFYSPPELAVVENHKSVNLLKMLSYLCGVAIAEVTSEIDPDNIFSLNDWKIGKRTDLDVFSRTKFENIVKKLISNNFQERLDLEEALKSISLIGSDENKRMAKYETYIENLKKHPTNCYTFFNDIKEKTKGKYNLMEQMVAERNPYLHRNQALKPLNHELEEFFKEKGKSSCSMFVLLGESGLGKSLALQTKFLDEVENWKEGKPLPLYIDMDEEGDLTEIMKNINNSLACHLNLEDRNEAIHFFIDNYEYLGDDNNSINHYLKTLKDWKFKKVLLAIRIDSLLFTKKEDFSDVINFENLSKTIQFLPPLNYVTLNKTQNIENMIRTWLQADDNKLEKENLIKAKFNYFGLDELVRTQMIFNMIMILLNGETPFSDYESRNLTEFEVYERHEEIVLKRKWSSVLGQDEESRTLREENLKQQLEMLSFEKNKLGDEFMQLREFGQNLAFAMWNKHKNHLNFFKLFENFKKNYEALDLTSFFFICKVLGLKMNKPDLTKKNMASIKISFENEILKHYYITRAIKKALCDPEDENFIFTDEALFIFKSILDDKRTINNLSFMRLFGKELASCPRFKMRLRHLLDAEKARVEGSLPRSARAAVILSLLVAGKYQFYKEDLGKLNLNGANLTYGMFYGSNFDYSSLEEANLEFSNLKKANFFKSNLAGVKLGVSLDLIGHTGAIICVRWSPDAKFIATSANDKKLIVWDAEKGESITEFEGYKAVDWSNDSRKLASDSADSAIKIWDIYRGACERTLKGHKKDVMSINWCRDGVKVASGSKDRTIKIWDYQTGNCLKTIEGHSGDVLTVCWSTDTSKIASAGEDKTVKVWDTGTWDCVFLLNGHEKKVVSLCWNTDNKSIASVGADKKVKIWSLASGSCVQTITEGGLEEERCVAWRPDSNYLAIGGDDKKIKIWDTGTKNEDLIQKISGHSAAILTTDWSPCGNKLASAGVDKIVKIWECKAEDEYNSERISHVKSISWSINKLLASGGSDGKVKIWDSTTFKCIRTLEAHKGVVNHVVWSFDGEKIVSCGEDKTIKVWDFKQSVTLTGHQDSINCLFWVEFGNKLISGSGDKTIKIWNTENGLCEKTLVRHKKAVRCIETNMAETIIASGSSDKTIVLWEYPSGKFLRCLEGHKNSVWTLAWCSDQIRIATGSEDKTIKIWNIVDGDCLHTLKGHTEAVHSLRWNYDGVRIISGSADKTVKIWDSFKRLCVTTLDGHSDSINSVCLGLDGKEFASGGEDKSIKIWECQSEGTDSEKWCVKNNLGETDPIFTCQGGEFRCCKTKNEQELKKLKNLVDQRGGKWYTQEK